MATQQLFSRDVHRDAITRAFGHAVGGTAEVLVFHGAPGSGKTALLGLADELTPPGALVLRASGHLAERDLPYAGLHELLTPVRELLVELPEPQAALLGRAVAFEPGGPGSSLSIANSLLQFITHHSEQRPVIVLIDDMQWLDSSSRQALIFAARRLEADAVAMVIGVREDGADELRGIGSRQAVGSLDIAAARDFLRVRFPDLSATVAETIIERSGGLPLALAEIPVELGADRRAAREPLPARFPTGRSLERLYETRLDELGIAESRALLLASLEDLDAIELAATLAVAGHGVDDLDAAERLGLIRLEEGRCLFGHPTVRSAAQSRATSTELRRAHHVLAEVFGSDPVRRASHLHAAAVGPDQRVADALARAAEVAADRGGLAEAAALWEAAASRSTDASSAQEWCSQAVTAYIQAGNGLPALRLLEQLIAGSTDTAEQTGWQCQRIVTNLWARGGLPDDSDELAARARSLATGDDATAAVDVLMALATSSLIIGDYTYGKRIADFVRAACPVERLPIGHRLMGEVLDVMVGAGGAGEFLRSDWTDRLTAPMFGDPAIPVGFAGIALGWIDEIDACEAVAQRCYDALQTHGEFAAARLSAGPLACLVHERRGDWARAELEYASAERAAIDTDFTAPFPFIALRHAYLLAAQGRDRECEALRSEAARMLTRRSPSFDHLDACVRGMLLLATGQYAQAAGTLATAAELERRMGAVGAGYTSRFADQFQAAWHLGTAADLAADLDEFESAAHRTGHPTNLATAARCRAMLVEPGQIDEAFERAMVRQGRSPQVFELARTQLCWGLRLRRARRKADARVQLLAAQQIFERLNAGGWLSLVRAELAACGHRRTAAPAAQRGPLSTLTPREFEVAQAVASGLSNPDAAIRLFISQRTVEYHLSNVYRKLDLADRRGLTTLFSPVR